ncbi:MAG: restriction endonuclease subunit S [Ruminococcaceae bacterium]|nr:restriction endonuclease subunit S [Oscillospiraceae bacterium]
MREMKDSGVAWIGKIPSDWPLIRFKDKYSNIKEVAKERSVEYERLALTLKGVIKRPKDDSEGLQPKEFDDYQILRENDFVFKMIDLQNISTSRVGLSPYTGLISPAYIRFAPKEANQYNQFVYYYLMSLYYNCVYNNLGGNGVRSALNGRDMGEFIIPYPNESEQRTISAFLDQKCSRVDTLIANVQTQIEKLKIYKKSLVIECITKGMHLYSNKKSTKIEWISELPAHWGECRIKNVIFPKDKPVLPTDQIITCFRDGEVTLRSKRREDGFTVSFTEHGYHGVDIGDLVVHGMDAFAGAIGCSDSRGKTTPVVHVCHTAGNNRYFMYYLRAMAYGNILMDLSNGVRIRSSDYRNFDRLGVFGIAVPPRTEQDEIVNFLDEKCSMIDSLIVSKQAKIEKLEQYKRSLIYEYVTGKKEVS